MNPGGTGYTKGDWSLPTRDLANWILEAGWDSGFAKFFRRGDIDLAGVSNNDFAEFQQGVWTFLLNPVPIARILSIDGSLGSTAFQLSMLGGKTVSLHPSPSFGKATSMRFAAGSVENARVVVGEFGEGLPFRERTFDLVCVHNLDRVISTARAESANRGRLLDSVTRVVRENGVLFLSGTGIHPLRGTGRSGVPGMISILSRLLRTGWHVEMAFDFFEEIGDTALLRIRLLKRRLPSFRDLFWFAVHFRNYGIVARRDGNPETPPAVNPWILKAGLPPGNRCGGTRTVHVGSSGVLRIDCGDRIVRFPRTQTGVQSCRRNHGALKELQERSFSFRTPAPMEYAIAPVPYFAEERLSGKKINYRNASKQILRHFAEEGLRALQSLQAGTTSYRILDENFYREHFEERLAGILSVLPDEERREILKSIASMKRKVLGIRLTVSVGHGDFKVTNFLQDSSRRITAVVDWDRYEGSSPVFVDCIWLLAYNLGLRKKTGWPASILMLPRDPVSAGMLRSFLEVHGADPSPLKLYCLMTMLHFLRYLHRRELWLPAVRGGVVRPFLEEFREYANGREKGSV